MSRGRDRAMPRAATDEGGAPALAAGDQPLQGLERRAWIALLLLTTFLHLFQLGARPFHHDESIHAWFSNHLAFEGDYKYDPVYHGPVQYMMVATCLRAGSLLHILKDSDPSRLGRGDVAVRVPAALGGVALVALALLLRPRFGPAVAFVSGLLLALSPNLLYYTRFCREDVWSLLGTAGAFLTFDAWWRRRRLMDLALCALFSAVAFAAKENFYVLLALMVPSVAAFCLEPGRGIAFWSRVRALVDFLEENQTALLGAFLLFFVVSELLYTLFLVHPDSGNPARDAITYWWGQHKVERVGGPKTYYLPRMLQYEFAIFLPAFAWLAFPTRRLSGAERFLVGWGFSSILMYGYLGEKTPWLLVYQVLPFVPFAALGWVALGRLATGYRLVGAGVAFASVLSAASLCFWHPALTPQEQHAESVIYVQTTPELLKVVDEIRAAAGPGIDPLAAVDGEAAWPMSWYVRELPVAWSLPTDGRKPLFVIADPAKGDEADKLLGPGYSREEIPLRAWWLPELSWKPLHPTPQELLTYLFTRRPWRKSLEENPIGSQSVLVYRKKPDHPAPAPVPPPPGRFGS